MRHLAKKTEIPGGFVFDNESKSFGFCGQIAFYRPYFCFFSLNVSDSISLGKFQRYACG